MSYSYDLTRGFSQTRNYKTRAREFVRCNRIYLFPFLVLVIISLSLCYTFSSEILEEDFSKFVYPQEIANFNQLIAKLDETTQASRNEQGHHHIYSTILKTLQDENLEVNVSNARPYEQFNNLEFTIQPRERCSDIFNKQQLPVVLDSTSEHSMDGDQISIVIVVKSAVNNFVRRQAIRQTWAANGPVGSLNFRTLFMVGTCHENNPVPKSLEKLSKWTPDDCEAGIRDESNLYGDLIQSSGIDSYYNNTYKTVMILKWVSEECKSDYFLALDDDFVFEATNFVSRLESLALNQDITPEENLSDAATRKNTLQALKNLSTRFLYTGYMRDVKPRRGIMDKWTITIREYPFDRYPKFITGGHILMSHKTVRHMYLATFFTKSLKFDDVYLGIIAHKLSIEASHVGEFMCSLDEYLAATPTRSNATNCIGVHDIEPQQLIELWSKRQK